MIAQWTGTPGPQEGSGFKVQTRVGKSLWPCPRSLNLTWGCQQRVMLKGLGTRLRMVQTHWWNAGENCVGPLPLSLSLGYRWVVGWGLLFCYPKHAQLPHIALKPILQTLTTRVWMVSRYHPMGLIVTIFFTKSHQIGTLKSEQGDFSIYLKPLFFCRTIGKGF